MHPGCSHCRDALTEACLCGCHISGERSRQRRRQKKNRRAGWGAGWVRSVEPTPSHRAIFERDGWCCRYCPRELSQFTATIDHVIPRGQGGPSQPDNCVTSCRPCNAKKGCRTPEEAGMTLRNLDLVGSVV